jgi:hypothetical protein
MLTSILLLALSALGNCMTSASGRRPSDQPKGNPKRIIAGVSAVDTPLVRAAQTYARAHTNDAIYKHVMRAWLFGALIIDHNSTLRESVDMEVHAVAALLHDLGWDRTPNSTLVSPDRRFEVDAAIAARSFIRGHEDGRKWEERRVQLVWDAIALHTERRIAYFKEIEVQVVSRGVGLDFDGPGEGVTKEEYASVEREFPRDDLKKAINDNAIWLCQTKPVSTYGKLAPLSSFSLSILVLSITGMLDNWLEKWGDKYVDGYAKAKLNRIDTIFSHL